MKSAAKNNQIASYDDLFKTDAERQADTQERVQSLPLDKLVPIALSPPSRSSRQARTVPG